MTIWKIIITPLLPLWATMVGSCNNSAPVAGIFDDGIFHTLPDGITSIKVDLNLSGSAWTVIVRNRHGTASDTIFAVNDHRRSNIYLTSRKQLVVIEQGGGEASFYLPDNGPPEPIPGARYSESDSDNWRYVGVIKGEEFLAPAQMPECIALLGAGSSPYRLRYQTKSFC